MTDIDALPQILGQVGPSGLVGGRLSIWQARPVRSACGHPAGSQCVVTERFCPQNETPEIGQYNKYFDTYLQFYTSISNVHELLIVNQHNSS